jgi:hypothetical protein
MAWERRKRGGLYYTTSHRENGRVVREYLGCSEVARAIALLDRAAREERLAMRLERERERERRKAALEPLRAFSTAVDELATATFEAAGYHRHKGQWRRRRN